MKHCTHAWLVGLLHDLPTDPAIADEGGSPIIGCSHLVCGQCGAAVRHADHRSTTRNDPPPRSVLAALYDARDPASSPLLDGTPLHRDSRAYFCRCGWAAVDLGGVKSVGSIDAPWGCGGHPGPGEARPAIAAVAPALAAPATIGPKLRIVYGRGVNPEFATASELRDSLLASYPAAAFFGAPVVELAGVDNVAPAWGWVIQLVRTRTDWWPALGTALQHAVADGDALARTAFADLLADFRDSLVLLPWTAPLVATMPDVRSRSSGTGWGVPDLRLETIVADQQTDVAELRASGTTVTLLEYGKGGRWIEGPLTTEAELRSLLEQTAHAGQFPDGDKGPWSWLGFERRTHDDWLGVAFLRIARTLDAADEPLVFALLDWLSEEQDLWQLHPLLVDWDGHPPAWAKTAANKKPRGWKRTIRSAHGPKVKTLGDVVRQALARATRQLATPPVLDLPLRFRPTTP